jgi:hypothetical protein
MVDKPISEAFAAIVEWSTSLGAKRINQLDGCWEGQVDDQWWIAINGHDEKTKCSKGATVPAFNAYVEFNGWPAGFVNPRGGVLCAGAAANEDTLIAALQRKSEEA